MTAQVQNAPAPQPPKRTTPPTRDPLTLGYVKATELPDGVVPPIFFGDTTNDGVRSPWNGHRPSKSAPWRVSSIPCASTNRCSEISFFSRSMSASGSYALQNGV